MDDLLVKNPIKYLLNFIGMKNKEEFELAIEIHLAEKVFEPRFDNGLNYEKLKELNLKVGELYGSVGGTNLTALFYFHYVDFAIESGVIEDSMVNEFKMYVAEGVLRKSAIKSRIAKNLLKTSDFYKDFHNNKINSLNDTHSIEKLMGLITVQNKELYHLEMERMESFDEYKVYEKYRKELESAEELCNEGVSCIES